MLNNRLQMQLKLFQKEQFKKQQKQLVIWLLKTLLKKLQKKLPQNTSEKVKSEAGVPKGRYTKSTI